MRAAPDMAEITLGVTIEAETAAAALDATSARLAEVMSVLSDAGVAAPDLQTSGFSLSPVWDNRDRPDGPRGIVGYRASNRLAVRVRALENLGAILGAVAQSGANDFHGLRFGLQDPGPLTDAARREAVAEARRKAALYAEAAGVALGPLLRLSEPGAASGPPMLERNLAMAEAVPIAEGEVAVAATVTMEFAIAQ